jgi:hypothetical protein
MVNYYFKKKNKRIEGLTQSILSIFTGDFGIIHTHFRSQNHYIYLTYLLKGYNFKYLNVPDP